MVCIFWSAVRMRRVFAAGWKAVKRTGESKVCGTLLCGRRVVDRQYVLAVAGAEEVQIGILSNG
jgi:hypothetical protein